MIKPIKKPTFANFSSGPTKKPEGWSINKLNLNLLGRYHRSKDVRVFLKSIFEKLKESLNIPQNYKILLNPGSCTGAMQSVIWSVLGDNKITSIVYDFWGEQWSQDIKRLKYKQEIRKNLNGKMPSLENISKEDDIMFVWTGTTNGMSVNNLDWISESHNGLVISDITSSVFISKINWEKIDISVFSWQKALGSESQHGITILSPKACDRIKHKKKHKHLTPKILDINEFPELINTPSLLCMADFQYCLSWFVNKGGLKWSTKLCKENFLILNKWEKENNFVKYFCRNEDFRSITPSYFIFNENIDVDNIKRILLFLETENIAHDINSYRKAPLGIRIWTGPTIIKKDLIALTKWLDWTFYNFIK